MVSKDEKYSNEKKEIKKQPNQNNGGSNSDKTLIAKGYLEKILEVGELWEKVSFKLDEEVQGQIFRGTYTKAMISIPRRKKQEIIYCGIILPDSIEQKVEIYENKEGKLILYDTYNERWYK